MRWPWNCEQETRKKEDSVRWDKLFLSWADLIEALKKKWANYSQGLISALAAEEVKMRREEVLKQIMSQKQGD
jgi:hypothetical protein